MKKTLSVIISFLMLLGICSLIPVIYAADDPADPIAVSDAAGFAAMDQTGSYYLTADITLSETYVGTFAGILDGKGHTITVSAPIFENVKGTVKNLTVSGEIKSSAEILAAVAVNAAEGSKFENITNTANVIGDAKATKRAGAIFGLATSGSVRVEVINCKNSGNINAYVAGGIAGRAENDILVSGCVNTGKITGGDTLSGILAWPVETFTVENCINGTEGCGAIIGDTGDSSGGIISYISENSSGTVTGCVNYSDIYNTGRCAAGIISRLGKNSSATFVDCRNYGNMTNTNASYACGGIAGESGGSVFFKNCVNYGNVKAEGNKAGGIAGYLDGITECERCINYGDIAAAKQAGGLIAHCGNNKVDSGDYIFKYCGNEGNVTATASTASGLVAYCFGNASHAPKIVGCYSIGNISGGEETCGIIGYVNNAPQLSVRNCFVSGKLATTGSGYKTCALFFSNFSESVDMSGVSGNYYTADSAECERYDKKEYVPSASNLTDADLSSGKLAYELNSALGENLFFQTLGEDMHPTLDSTRKTVLLDNGKYVNEKQTDDPAPSTGDSHIIILLASAFTVFCGIALWYKKTKLQPED